MRQQPLQMLVAAAGHALRRLGRISQVRQLLRTHRRELAHELDAVPGLGGSRRAESVRSGGTRGVRHAQIHLDRFQMLVGAVFVEPFDDALQLAVPSGYDPGEGSGVAVVAGCVCQRHAQEESQGGQFVSAHYFRGCLGLVMTQTWTDCTLQRLFLAVL